MKKRERVSTYKKAIDKWGESAQLFVCVEEFSELIQILCKRLAGKEHRREDLLEEMADCRIMLEQLEVMFFQKGELNDAISKKLNKVIKKLERN
jgi:hypothetical protein